MATSWRGPLTAALVTFFTISAPGMYGLASNGASRELNQRLKSKVERIADTDSSGSLSLNEALAAYRIVGINNPEGRLIEMGFNLRAKQMQDYLVKTGNFDPSTDIYKFKDGLKDL